MQNFFARAKHATIREIVEGLVRQMNELAKQKRLVMRISGIRYAAFFSRYTDQSRLTIEIAVLEIIQKLCVETCEGV